MLTHPISNSDRLAPQIIPTSSQLSLQPTPPSKCSLSPGVSSTGLLLAPSLCAIHTYCIYSTPHILHIQYSTHTAHTVLHTYCKYLSLFCSWTLSTRLCCLLFPFSPLWTVRQRILRQMTMWTAVHLTHQRSLHISLLVYSILLLGCQ